jgi:glycine cleavage system T protein (aminomethyltransferase)
MVSGGFDLRALRRDYGDVHAEASSCRSAAALFDFSFMSRIRVEGRAAAELIGALTPRRIDDLPSGRIRYALRVAADGRVLGDLTIWRLGTETFEIFDGTGDAAAQLQLAAAASAATVRDFSSETAILVVQGPASLRALSRVTSAEQLRGLAYFAHAPAEIAGMACRIGRLGYTGERGFEILLPRAAREEIWAMLAPHARPAGFAAADILRIEAGFLLFANELRVPITAAELGLAQFAAGGCAPCRGAAARERRVRLLCFEASCDSEPVLWQQQAGASFPPPPGSLFATSACRSIVTNAVLGLGYAVAEPRAAQLVDPAGRFHEIREVSLPFHDPRKRRPRGGWRNDLLPDIGST